MNTNARYELKGRAFELMTGQLAPGKDMPAGTSSMSYEERAALWDEWLRDNGDCVQAMMRAFEEMVPPEEEKITANGKHSPLPFTDGGPTEQCNGNRWLLDGHGARIGLLRGRGKQSGNLALICRAVNVMGSQ